MLCSSVTGIGAIHALEGLSRTRSAPHVVGLVLLSVLFVLSGYAHAYRMEADVINFPDALEAGEATRVNFRQSYSEVPMVFILPSGGEPDSVAIRLETVTTEFFSAVVVESPNFDNVPSSGIRASYLAVEAGQHTLPDGQIMEVGSVLSNAVQHGNGVQGVASWNTVSFIQPFVGRRPIVIGMIQSHANEAISGGRLFATVEPWIMPVTRNAYRDSFQIALERGEVSHNGLSMDNAAEEEIAYLALSKAIHSIDMQVSSGSITYETIVLGGVAGRTNNPSGCYNIDLAMNYPEPPLAFAIHRTRNGADGAWVHRCNEGSVSQIGLFMQEDTARDSEVRHAAEVVSILIISEPFAHNSEHTVVDHYAISYPQGTPGLICEPLAVRITAHGSATDHNDIVPPDNTTTITLATSPMAGGWALRAGNGTFTPPNQYTFDGTETFVEFWLTQTTVTSAPHIDISVSDGEQRAEGSTEDDNIAFTDAVFRFFADGTGDAIGTQIAGKESSIAPGQQVITLRSVQANTDTGACEARIQGVQEVGMAHQCETPASCQATSGVRINGGVTTPGDGSLVPVMLDFDGDGAANISFNYNDAGRIQLLAWMLLPANGVDPAVSLFGASNLFVVRPAGLCVEAIETGSDCPSANSSCSVFKRAGEAFTLRLRAVAWEGLGEGNSDFCVGNNGTPSFQLDGIGLSTSTIAPTGLGTRPGGLAHDILNMSSDTEDLTTQSIDEVGVFTITATPPDYLGEPLAASTSEHIGRFIPFALSVVANNPAFTPGCGSFSYLGQPFQYATQPILTVSARNQAYELVGNYQGEFFRLTQDSLGFPVDTEDDGGYQIAGGHGLDTGLVNGKPAITPDPLNDTATLTFSIDDPGLAVQRPEQGPPTAPFMAEIGLQINVIDLDGVEFLDAGGDPQNPAHFGAASSGDGIAFSGGQKEQRWGRLVLENAFGSELLPLELVVRAEYYDGHSFLPNVEDGCSDYAATGLGYTILDGLNNVPVASGAGTLHDGVADVPLRLTNTQGEVGSVMARLATISWLRHDWDNDGRYLEDPFARVDWGIYAGPSHIIYIREP